jgi:hypothetical protein
MALYACSNSGGGNGPNDNEISSSAGGDGKSSSVAEFVPSSDSKWETPNPVDTLYAFEYDFISKGDFEGSENFRLEANAWDSRFLAARYAADAALGHPISEYRMPEVLQFSCGNSPRDANGTIEDAQAELTFVSDDPIDGNKTELVNQMSQVRGKSFTRAKMDSVAQHYPSDGEVGHNRSILRYNLIIKQDGQAFARHARYAACSDGFPELCDPNIAGHVKGAKVSFYLCDAPTDEFTTPLREGAIGRVLPLSRVK